MIRFVTGTVILGMMTAAFADDVSVTPEQVRAKSSSHTIKGEPGSTAAHAVVNFSDIAAQPAPKKSAKAGARVARRAPAGLFPSATESTAPSAPLAAAAKVGPIAQSPPLATNFLGTTSVNNPFIPPDTMGAVGPRHLMVTVNGEVKIQDRAGNTLSSVTLDQFFARLGPFASFFPTFDPKVYFDSSVNRWFVVACADAETDASAVLVAVSANDDPRGVWFMYKIDADSNNTYWADYPSVGFNSKWLYVAMNMFPNSATGSYGGEFVWVFDKKALLNGPPTASFTKMAEPSGFTMLAATTFDQTEQNLYIAETVDDKTIRISTISGPVGSESLNVGVSLIKSTSYNWNFFGGNIGKQLGSSELIEGNDARMLSCIFRNGAIWFSHPIFFPAIGTATHVSAQYWQVTVNGTILQQGLLDDPAGNVSYTFPTIAVNKNGDMMMGYSRMAPDQYASANYAFRASSDPKNTLQSDGLIKAGEASYFKDFGSGRNRWGDYSVTCVDPLNDQDMWTLQEYASSPRNNEDQWGVWWGMINRSVPPDNILEIVVTPPDQSDLAAGQATDFFATVTDSYLQIINATVTANIPGRGPITFHNDGIPPDVTANDNVYSATFALNSSSEQPIVFTATAPGMTAGSVTNSYNVVPRPPNDNFANAAKIPSSGIFGLNSAQVPNNFATSEPGEPLHAGVSNFRSLWWNYSTPTAAQILVDTSGSGSKVVVAVYTGSSLTALIPVASTNPPPNKPAILKFDAQPGTTYHIAVAAASEGEKGIVRLRVEPNGEPDITPPLLTVDYPPSGLVTNTTTVVFHGTVIDPTPNASGVNAVLIHVEDVEPELIIPATISGTTWVATVPLSSATNDFEVTAVDFANNVSDGIGITVYYKASTGSTNDLFGFARVLPPPSGVDFASNTNATREFNEPLHGGNEGGHSLWWSYTPTKSGVLFLSTEGSTFDTLLGVYTVNDPLDRQLGDLIPLAQNDDAPDATDGHSEINVAVEAGRLYYIAVDGYAGATGDVRLEYTFGESGVFNLTTSSGGGGTISPNSGAFPVNSAVSVIATPDRYKQFSRFLVTQNGITTIVTNGPIYTFTITGNTQVTAEFTAKQFADDFQTGDFSKLPYQISGTPEFGQHWVVSFVETNSVTHEGSLAARVRPNLPDSTTASLVLVTNLAAGTGSFEFTVNSETNYDKFEFSLDGRVLGTWSGFIPWQTFFFDIPAKSTPIRLEWRYSKDLATTAPNELVAIDNLDITTAAPPPPQQLQLSITADAAQVTITATGPTNTDFRLETSTDLVHWTPVLDAERNSGTTGVVTFIQPPSGSARFYRVAQL